MSDPSITQACTSKLSVPEAASILEVSAVKPFDAIKLKDLVSCSEFFVNRHIDPYPRDIQHLLDALGFSTLDALIENPFPPQSRMQNPLQLEESCSEYELLAQLKAIASKNQVFHSFYWHGLLLLDHASHL